MHIKKMALALALFHFPALPAAAMEGEHNDIYHAFRLETDIGRIDHNTSFSWDLDGWIGKDYSKLWVRSEGEVVAGEMEYAELQALYSRNVATFWDAQIGIRQDVEPQGQSWLVVGVTGLAPYFFETEAHVFLRTDGVAQLRVRYERDFLITNRLIVEPWLEANAATEDDREAGFGAGLMNVGLGVQTRYEFNRAVAPYIDLNYQRKFGQTADYARARNEDRNAVALRFGIRWVF